MDMLPRNEKKNNITFLRFKFKTCFFRNVIFLQVDTITQNVLNINEFFKILQNTFLYGATNQFFRSKVSRRKVKKVCC